METVLANDLSENAFHSMQSNVKRNGLEGKVIPSLREATMLMYEHREPLEERFDVIDLDPYGSPSLFLDSTLQCVKDGGKLVLNLKSFWDHTLYLFRVRVTLCYMY